MSKVHFRTNTLLKSIIGKDLITDDNIAILELVKNSFDAGSSKVIVEFQDIKESNNSKIIISDSGVGMSKYDLENKWLNIAYSEKKEKKEEYGRILAGNKGVGRFSCDKLGKFLTIYTRKENEKFIKLFIDWQWFEQEGNINLNIQDIEFEIIEYDKENFIKQTGLNFNHGTILEISSLRENWNYNKILSLKRQLERLINPNQSFNSNPFQVEIRALDFLEEESNKGDYEKINGFVKNRIFENLNFKTTSIESYIDSQGKTITTVLQDRGNEIFTLTERNNFNLLQNIRVYIYYLNPYSKAYFTKQTGIRSVDFGSIFLFINGFRIPPYGDDGDDWLGMESRKGQGYSRYLGTREVVGRIEIFDENDNFKIISSRAGVVNNETFNQLVKSNSPFGYYYKIFRRLERFVAEGIKWDSTTEDERKLELKILNDPDWNESKEVYQEDSLTRNKRVVQVINNIIDVKKDELINLIVNEEFIEELIIEQSQKAQDDLDNIAKQLKSKNLTPEELTRFLNKIDLSREELKSFSDLISPYKSDSIHIDSANESLIKKYNELKIEKETLEKKLQEEENARKKAEDEKKKVELSLEEAQSQNLFLKSIKSQDFNEVLNLMHHIGISTATIQNYIKGATFKLDNNIAFENNELKNVFANLNYELNKIYSISKFATKANFKVETKNSKIDIINFIEEYILSVVKPLLPQNWIIKVIETNVKTFETEFKPLELIIVLDNLISNAKKAIKEKIKISRNLTPEINIIFSELNENLIIKFTDNGIGIERNNFEKIFDYGFTTTDGSGLGLTHVKDLINKMNGVIVLDENLKDGTQFTITIKKRI